MELPEHEKTVVVDVVVVVVVVVAGVIYLVLHMFIHLLNLRVLIFFLFTRSLTNLTRCFY